MITICNKINIQLNSVKNVSDCLYTSTSINRKHVPVSIAQLPWTCIVIWTGV